MCVIEYDSSADERTIGESVGYQFVGRVEGEPVQKFWAAILASVGKQLEESRKEEAEIAHQYRDFRVD